MKTAIYIRVSTERQASDEKVSVTEQIKDCEQRAKEKGYAIVETYTDKEKYKSRGKLVEPSGKRADRPAYLRMIRDGHAGKFDIILAWREDRLYRGVRACLPLSELLEERNENGKPKVTVELVKETFDVKMMWIKASIGKMELDGFRERSAMGIRGRLEKNKMLGGCVPLGYNRVDGKLVIDEEESKWVYQLFWWYAVDRIPTAEIRRRLIENNVPQRGTGGKIKIPWRKSVIYGVLKNVTYTGEMTIKAAGETCVLQCPKIIEGWLFERAQERLSTSKNYPLRHFKELHLLAGLLYCAVCKNKMKAVTRYRFSKRRGVETVESRHYVCREAEIQKESFTCRRKFGAKKVEEKVWELVSNALEHPEVIREQMERKARQLREETSDIEGRIDYLARQLERIQDDRQWLITQARTKTITQAEFETEMKVLAEQREDTAFELQELKQATAQHDEANRLLALANEFFANLREGLEYLNQCEKGLVDDERRKLREEKRRVLQMLITRIDLDQQGNLAVEGVLDKNIVTAQIKSPVPMKKFLSR